MMDRNAQARADGRTVVIAAGGTGGHLFPAQALAETLSARGLSIVLMTDDRGRAFTDAFPEAEIRMVEAATFAGRGLLGKISAAGSIVSGIVSAYGMLGEIRPAAVVGFGGYPALPAMAGAVLRRIPTCIHEQNAILGRVNRFIAPYTDLVAAAFDGMARVPSSARSKLVVTGNPIRAAIAARAGAAYDPPRPGGPLRLLVFGGSQGARVFGEVVPAALALLDPADRARLEVVQQVREEDLERVRTAYDAAGIATDLRPFFTDMPDRLEAAHLVIARAGASSVTELAVMGRPSILVPLPGAMDDHQTANAGVLAALGAAWRVPQTDFTAQSLRNLMGALMNDPAALARAAESALAAGHADATTALGDMVVGLTQAGRAYARERLGRPARPA